MQLALAPTVAYVPARLSLLPRVLEIVSDLAWDALTKRASLPRIVTDAHERSPMPQPSPWGADMPPAVLGVRPAELEAFQQTVIQRYLRTIQSGWLPKLLRAARWEGPAQLSDAQFGDLIYEDLFSRLLVDTLDPVDQERFASVLPGATGTLYKIDHSFLSSYRKLDGVEVAPTVGLFSLENGRLHPLAISVHAHTITPDMGDRWERARLFFLQGCTLHIVLGVHPHLHFPMDAVAAVSREVLPSSHPIRRVVEAHSYLQLPLNYGVLHNPRSVAHNPPDQVYAPFPADRDSIFQGISDCYAGIEGNSAYAAFRYPMQRPCFPGPYCDFLGAYYDAILDFCRAVTRAVRADDADVVAWADTLSGLVPGFPSAAACQDPDTLARALAGFVHAVSVWHATEHHTYSRIDPCMVPTRLRVAPPTDDPSPCPTPREQWLRRSDVFRHLMTHDLFFEAHTVRTLLNARYGFADQSLRRAVDALHARFREIDARPPGRRYAPLARMACSIQF